MASIKRKVREIFQYRLSNILLFGGADGVIHLIYFHGISKPVAYSPGSKNKAGIGKVFFYFGSQPVNVSCYRVLIAFKFIPPYEPKQFFAGVTMTGMGS
jgi:hypothetical protein